jgi:hypothetical protein
MATPVTSVDVHVVRSDAEVRVLAVLAAFPYPLGSVWVRFSSYGDVHMAVHEVEPAQVAVMATRLGLDLVPEGGSAGSGPVRFVAGVSMRGRVSLDWYPKSPEPRPETEHRRRQWDALVTALAASSGG